MSLTHDFNEQITTLPHGWTTACIHITFEHDAGDIRLDHSERRAAAAETLRWLGARETGSGLDLHLTPASVSTGLSAIIALEAGGRRGQVSVVSVSCADRYELQVWPNKPEHLRGGELVDTANGTTLRAVMA